MGVVLEKTSYNEATKKLAVDAFVRSITVNRGRPIGLLLGAGASISSGMPSAEQCIWEWKRDIFVTNNPGLHDMVGELSLPGTRARIQSWLDLRKSYPPLGSDEEYSFYAQECYPTVSDRRSFFHAHIQSASPHVGYRLLPFLVKAGLLRTVWTTNFDGLAARACAAADVVAVEVGIDSAQRTLRPHVKGELRVVSLHGDFRYDPLKNTREELQEQEELLKQAFEQEARNHDLVVIGYSGRDESLMSVLRAVYAQPGSSRIYWCGYSAVPNQAVSELLQLAQNKGREAFYVATEGFDDVLARAALHYLEGADRAAAQAILTAANCSQPAPKLFSVPPLKATALFKSNAYPVSFPLEVFRVELDFPTDENRRQWLEERLADAKVCCVVIETGALLLGQASDITNALGAFIKGSLSAMAIAEKDFATAGRVRGLLQRGLVCSLAEHLQVNCDRRRRLWEQRPYRTASHQNATFDIHRAVSVKFLALEGRPLAVLMPEVVVYSPSGAPAPSEIAKIIKNQVYGYQHNEKFNQDLSHWTARLTDVEIAAWGGGQYSLNKAPWFAGLTEKFGRPLPQHLQRSVRQTGLIVQDAPLVFSSAGGSAVVRDVNPLRGLVRNRPWDYSLTASGLSPEIEIAVICPRRSAGRLRAFLQGLHESVRPEKTEEDYLLPYESFSSAFGTPLSAPNPGDPAWLDLDDALTGSPLATAKALGQRICRGIELIRNVRPGAIVVIYVPSNWQSLNKVMDDTEQFNLHDYIKAFAARLGLSTQLVREETTLNPQKCRVRWWLALALYAKALRTPWRLDCIDDETAYVGIGYSIDQEADPGSHVLLGCGHLYSARGEGLQFRLGRIENPIMRGRNPFMSEDDARRTGDTIRQLFFDAKMRLPSRVVIHKRTRFTDEEKRGLTQGLVGVANVELIEINIEESLRYLASRQAGGGVKIDSFPVPRGTTVVMDGHSALLWVHGSAPNVKNPDWRYYQGKRRIPAPLMIRRYLGQSDIVQIATEILGLSKMNWNTFDYYSRLPATLDSASAIAKVGKYLSGFGSAPYDYRLLI